MKSGFELQFTTILLYSIVLVSYVINHYILTNNVKQRQSNKVYYCSCFYCIYQFFLDRLWCLQIKKCIYLIYFYMLKNDSRQILWIFVNVHKQMNWNLSLIYNLPLSHCIWRCGRPMKSIIIIFNNNIYKEMNWFLD